jgi:outer membrane protein TolC
VSAVLAYSAAAQVETTNAGPKMSLSLEECIRLALKDNLTLQVGDRVALGETADLDVRTVGRLGLEEARLTAEGAYGYYDPVFNGSGGQHYRKQPPRFESALGQFVSPGTRWNEDFALGFEGILPSGTHYELGSSMNRLSGTALDTREEFPPGFTNINFGKFVNLPWQYTSDAHIEITQPLLRDFWIDAGRLNIKIRKQDLKIAEHSFRLLTMDIIQRVAVTYYDLIAAIDQVKTRTKALELASQLVSENKKKEAAGTIAPLEARQSESQEATAKTALIASQFGVQQAENLLKSLITHDFASVQHLMLEPTERLVPVYQAFSLVDAWRNGLENRPDYLQAKEEVESRNLVLSYRKNHLFPALDLVGTYGRNGVAGSTEDSLDAIADNRNPYYGGALVLKFPLTFKSDRADYKRAKIQKQMAILDLKRREDAVLQEIDIAVKQVQSSYQATESSRAARKFAEEALDAEQKKLEAGRSTSFFVLQFQRDLTDASAVEIRAAAEYNKALQQLYFREGTTLHRNNVNLDVK